MSETKMPSSGQSGTPRGLKLESLQQRARDIHAALDTIKTVNALAAELLGEDTVDNRRKIHNSLRLLVREGYVARLGRGTYVKATVAEAQGLTVRPSSEDVRGSGVAKPKAQKVRVLKPKLAMVQEEEAEEPSQIERPERVDRLWVSETAARLGRENFDEKVVIALWAGRGNGVTVSRVCRVSLSKGAEVASTLAEMDYTTPLTAAWIDEAVTKL